jgi:hypothetical protein
MTITKLEQEIRNEVKGNEKNINVENIVRRVIEGMNNK